MSRLKLTIRYMMFHRLRSFLLIGALTITFFLPLSVQLLVDHYEETLIRRARNTPLVIGAKGSRFDLILNTLYFRAQQPDQLSMAAYENLRNPGDGDAESGTDVRILPIPLYNRHTARGIPIVGTTPDYYSFRDLDVQKGSFPTILGEVVLGAKVAKSLDLEPGDTILSDQPNAYDIATSYPLKMHVSGVLEETQTPDDRVIFTDLKTTWIIDGIGHGHREEEEITDSSVILKRQGNNVVFNRAIYQYEEITRENLDDFHFHGDPEAYPLTGIIVDPEDHRSATILRGRIQKSDTQMALDPLEVMEELMSIVFQVKKFFNANFLLIALATLLFLILIVLLSVRIRKREMETMFKIGCGRLTVFYLQATEICLILFSSLLLAGALAGILLYIFIGNNLILTI